MSGLMQAGAGGNNSYRDIVLKTPQESPRGVPIGIEGLSQTVDTRAQQVLAGRETSNKTFIANDLSGRTNCVFVARDPLGQDNSMDINSTEQIVSMAYKDP